MAEGTRGGGNGGDDLAATSGNIRRFARAARWTVCSQFENPGPARPRVTLRAVDFQAKLPLGQGWHRHGLDIFRAHGVLHIGFESRVEDVGRFFVRT